MEHSKKLCRNALIMGLFLTSLSSIAQDSAPGKGMLNVHFLGRNYTCNLEESLNKIKPELGTRFIGQATLLHYEKTQGTLLPMAQKACFAAIQYATLKTQVLFGCTDIPLEKPFAVQNEPLTKQNTFQVFQAPQLNPVMLNPVMEVKDIYKAAAVMHKGFTFEPSPVETLGFAYGFEKIKNSLKNRFSKVSLKPQKSMSPSSLAFGAFISACYHVKNSFDTQGIKDLLTKSRFPIPPMFKPKKLQGLTQITTQPKPAKTFETQAKEQLHEVKKQIENPKKFAEKNKSTLGSALKQAGLLGGTYLLYQKGKEFINCTQSQELHEIKI